MYLKKMLFTSLAMVFFMYSSVEGTEEITLKINLNCPESEQLEDLKKVIPDPSQLNVSYDEFKSSFTEMMTLLIALLESGAVYDAAWTINMESK